MGVNNIGLLDAAAVEDLLAPPSPTPHSEKKSSLLSPFLSDGEVGLSISGSITMRVGYLKKEMD